MHNSITDEEFRRLAVALNDIAWLLPRTIGREAAPGDDLPASEFEVMRLLVRRPGLSVGEVAAELAMQRSNVSTAVRALAARGLLERRRDGTDGRMTRLFPSERATANRDRREAAWGRALEVHLERLPRAEAERILAVSDPIRRLVGLLMGEPAPD